MTGVERAKRGVLLGAAGALYLAFLYCDLWVPGSAGPSALLKYSGIWLCFFYVLSCGRRVADRRGWGLVLLAQGITLVADYFLLFTGRLLPGVLVFCGAQLAYLFRYWPRGARPVFLPLAAGVLVLLPAGRLLGWALLTVAVGMGLYGCLLLAATLAAWRSRALPRAGMWLARWGMLLFVLCDINVLLFNTLPPGGAVYRAASLLMWVFYLPSQVLIALSAGVWPAQGENMHNTHLPSALPRIQR